MTAISGRVGGKIKSGNLDENVVKLISDALKTYPQLRNIVWTEIVIDWYRY